MTIRLGERIIAGGSTAKDDVTIVSNQNGEMQAVGQINKNDSVGASHVLYDWVGTLQEYQTQQIETLHPTWICFITDDDGVGSNSALTILDFKWSDRIINEPRWLRADTFSWQDGEVYSVAYMHLVNDLYENDVQLYCWASSSTSKIIYTKTQEPEVNSWTYDANGAQWKTVSSVTNNGIDVMGAPALEAGPYVRDSSGDMVINANIGVQHTETIGGTSITYYTAPDGHKICMPDQETAVETIYTNTGVAWFYILDTTNSRFKLPRTKFGFTGIRSNVGDYLEPAIPNIKYDVSYPTIGSSNGALTIGEKTSSYVGPASSNNVYFYPNNVNASTVSDVYKDGVTTVQPPATQMYLYFYAGEFSQSALENTAGITTETLNSKADISLFQVVSALPQNPDPNTFYFVVD